jgi:hypothetical protein
MREEWHPRRPPLGTARPKPAGPATGCAVAFMILSAAITVVSLGLLGWLILAAISWLERN